jgi:hypothetical protein
MTEVSKSSPMTESIAAVPSLSSRARQSGVTRLVSGRQTNSLPSRERVSAAIALVRERQAAGSTPNVTGVTDIVDLRKKLKTRASAIKKTGVQPTISMTSTSTSVSSGNNQLQQPVATNAGLRSPLVQLEQCRSDSSHEQQATNTSPQKAVKSGSFFQNIFASRSDAKAVSSKSNTALPNEPSMSDSMDDKPAENLPGANAAVHSFASSITTKAEESSKRDFHFKQSDRGEQMRPAQSRSTRATNEASRNRAAMPTVQSFQSNQNSLPTAPSIESDSDSDADVTAVDAKTMQDVNRFLDSLNMKPTPQVTMSSQADHVVTPSDDMEEDPIEALRQNSTDDYDDEESSSGSVNPETLAEIGAFIDAVAKNPTPAKKKTSKAHEQSKADAPTFSDPTETVAEPKKADSVIVDSEPKEQTKQTMYASSISSSYSTGSTNISQMRASKPSPSIYELVESSKSVGSFQSKDPPACIGSNHDPQKADPPAPNALLSEAVMWMHESQIAPSYSADTLESGSTINAEHPAGTVEEEKKEIDHENAVVEMGFEVSRSADEDTTAAAEDDTPTMEMEENDHGSSDLDNTPNMPYINEMGKSLSPVMEAPSVETDDLSGLDGHSDSNDEDECISLEETESEDPNVEVELEELADDKPMQAAQENSDYDDLLLEALGTHDVASPRAETLTSPTASQDEIQELHSEASCSSDADEYVVSPQNLSMEQDDSGDVSPASTESSDDVEGPVLSDEDDQTRDTGMEQAYDNFDLRNASTDASDADRQPDMERYAMLEAPRSEDESVPTEAQSGVSSRTVETQSEVSTPTSEVEKSGSSNLPGSPSMKNDDNDSVPWELKDIASEETMKAAGRTQSKVTSLEARSKARMLSSILSDDSSVPNSMRMERVESNDQVIETDSGAASEAGFDLGLDDVVVVEESEGVELLETSIAQENSDDSVQEESDDSVQEEDKYEERVDTPMDSIGDVPSAPSGIDSNFAGIEEPEGDEPRRPSVDPDGDIQRSVEGTIYNNRPDPDAEKLDAGDDFVTAFLQSGSISMESTGNDKDLAVRKKSTEEFEVAYSEKQADFENIQNDGYGFVMGSNSNENDSENSSENDSESEHENDKENDNESQDDIGGFLEQFAALEVQNDAEQKSAADRGLYIDISEDSTNEIETPCNTTPKSPYNLLLPSGIAKFFAGLDDDQDSDDEDKSNHVRHFQKLIAPVISGEKPSIIETAQIRQAARRAGVPLEIVDRFLDFAEGENPSILEVMSSQDESVLRATWDDMDDLNEDEAITAFLSRFGALKSGGHYANGAIEGIEEFVRTGSESLGEEVEVDAQFGFVNKELALKEDEEEWWQEAQQQKKQLSQRQPKTTYDSDSDNWDESSEDLSVANSNEIEDKGSKNDPIDTENRRNLSTPKRSGGGLQARKNFHADSLMINTKPTTSFGYHEVADKSEWLRKQAMASYGRGWERHSNWLSPRSSSHVNKPEPIDGVAAAENLGRFAFSKRLFLGAKPWKLPYKERTHCHSGYFDVDVYSIYESAAVDFAMSDDLDSTPWEHRDVKQSFLQERSIAFSRNWFGDLVRKRGNYKFKVRYCKPKSMEMPIENIPDPGEWTEEWYTTWKSPFDRRNYTTKASADASTSGSCTDNGSSMGRGSFTDASTLNQKSVGSGESSYSRSSAGNDDSDDDSWEEAPECGTIINVKQKIGERVTRVHPDYTSSLRRSRWRKKYFPRGTFPY